MPPGYSILINEPYGFRSGRSSLLNTIIFHNFILGAIPGSQVDMIITDLVKTFDQVGNASLYKILYKTGFGESLLS